MIIDFFAGPGFAKGYPAWCIIQLKLLFMKRLSATFILSVLLYSMQAQQTGDSSIIDTHQAAANHPDTLLSLLNLTCEDVENPMGIDVLRPRFGWQIRSYTRGVVQEAFRIILAESKESLDSQTNLIWDTKKCVSGNSIHCRYDGPVFRTGIRYFWKVQVWDNAGHISSWSADAWFETGLLNSSDWKARWIEPALPPIRKYSPGLFTLAGLNKTDKYPEEKLTPCSMLRKEFTIKKGLKRARIYATAHGIYALEINGVKADDREFAPEFTSYHKLLLYQVYDVTDRLTPGENVLGVTIADGWYGGRIGATGESAQYGNKHALLLQMELEYDDGYREQVNSDESWKCSTGPLVYADIWIGEKYDARLEASSWNKPGFTAAGWKAVDVVDYDMKNLSVQVGNPVRSVMKIEPTKIIITPKGETVVDLGQNIAGRLRMTVAGEAGTHVTLEHSEVLDEQGNFINNIIGINKDQKDVYVLKGGAREIFEPAFTFHGFRYVKVTGYPGSPTVKDFTGIVISSAVPATGAFVCSDTLLNQLQHNIVWSQRSNMLSIPTDCPQRERMGWTADIQVYGPTAMFNQNLSSFLSRWLRSLKADQLAGGQVPMVVPYTKGYRESLGKYLSPTSAGWGDACIIVPLELYEKYGDIGILEEYYETMTRWMDYVERQATSYSPFGFRMNPLNWFNKTKRRNEKYLWNTGFHYGDWLIPSKTGHGLIGLSIPVLVTRRIVASAYYGYSTALMANIAGLLGRTEDQKKYTELNAKIKQAFAARYVSGEGKLKPSLQGIYILALQFDLIPPSVKQKSVTHLVELIKNNGYRLDAGFLSIPFLMDVLCNEGHRDIAYKLLFQDECPSWLYEVNNGATTIWESWKAIAPDGKISPLSYNHYAFGCIGDWMYRTVGGLNTVEPGYRSSLIKPDVTGNISSASTSLETMYGTLSNSWAIANGVMTMSVSVPANTTAQIVLPNATKETILESGSTLSIARGIYNISQEKTGVVIQAGSGNFSFRYIMKQ